MPQSRRAAAISRWTLIAGIVVIVLGAASVPLLNLSVYTPTHTVNAYLRALKKGDASEARGLLQAPNPTIDAALNDAALSGAAALPGHAHITSSRVDGNTAHVTASVALGTKPTDIDFELVRVSPAWGLFHRWAIRIEQWPTVELQVSGSPTVDIGKASVPADQGPVPVFFPVGYGVGFNAQYLKAETQRVDVAAAGTSAKAALRPEPTQALRSEVQTIIRKQLDECAQQDTLMPQGCSFGYTTDNDVLGAVHWKVTKYPDVQLQADGSQLRVVPTAVGLELHSRMRDAVTARISEMTEPVSAPLSASVTVTGNSVHVEQDGGDSLGGG